MTEYYTIAAPCEGSVTEKRSEFIAQLFPVKTAEEAAARIEEVKQKHHKARHNVWAFRVRGDGAERYSDDGEPQGTGGIPVLSVLQKNELTDICCVVTRYFGGVLLGAPGLTRAYSSAAAEAVGASQIRHFCEAHRVQLITDYGMYGKVSYLLPDYGTVDAGSEFAENVILRFDVKTDVFPRLEAALTELYNGKADLTVLETHFVDFK